MGKVCNEQEDKIRSYFEEDVFTQLRKKGINEFEFSVEDSELREQLLEMLKHKKMMFEDEYSYRMESAIYKGFEIPSIYEIKEVDRKLLDAIQRGLIDNSAMLIERIRNCWDNDDAFLRNSEAFVVLKDNCIVGIIFGSARFKQYIVVDIEVQEEHRNRGLATALTITFVNRCIEKGYIVQWDHVASNKESEAIAIKCGFKLFKVRPYHWFHI